MRSLQEIATAIDAALEGDPEFRIQRMRPIQSAGPNDLTYLLKGKTPPPRDSIAAGAIIVHESADVALFPEATALLRTDNPHLGYARALEFLHPPQPPPFDGIDPAATVQDGVEVGEEVRMAPGVFVATGSRLGDRVVLHPGVCIGAGCVIDEEVVLHPRVVIYGGTTIGARTVIHAGAVIGADGFGFVPGPDGITKIQHQGNVRIEEDVEIGANATVDRGALDDTVIGRGSKLDNLVHIGHNTVIGPHCILAGQTGLAGSCELGTGVILAGQVGLAGHLTIGDGAQVGAKSGVHTDIPAGAKFFGYPATDFRTAARAHAFLNQIPGFRKNIEQFIRRLAEIEERLARSDER